MRWQLFKSKKFLIPFIILLVGGFFGVRYYKKSHQLPKYETVVLSRGNLTQTVEATGKIESVNDTALRFEIPGTVEMVKVKEGSVVKAGTLLAQLRLAELNAAVAQAQANLNQKLAGATIEDIAYYKAAVDAAQAVWNQSKIDAEAEIKTAEANVATAQNNLKLAEGGEESRIVTNAYNDAIGAIQASLPKLDDGLSQADSVLGIDNITLNDSFESYLASLDGSKLPLAQTTYNAVKKARDTARETAYGLTERSAHAQVDTAVTAIITALARLNDALSVVSDVLKATEPKGTLTADSLNTKKSLIETTRNGATLQYSTMVKQEQALRDAKASLTTYTIAYTKAKHDLEQANANALTSVQIKEASYNQAFANYQSKINPPREVDVAAYRAAVAQAVANRNKAIIQAPMDGVVTKVNKKIGESVNGADTMIEMLAPHYQVKVDVPETDVPKLKVGNEASITLDALGEDVKLQGTIMSIDPGSTEIQDVVYYKITISLADSDKPIKPGMTANVSVKTDSRENVLFIPLRVIRTRDDNSKYVRVLENKQEKEVPVKLGLKANENKVEILAGLQAGQEVIVNVKK